MVEHFDDTDLSGAQFRNVNLTGARMRSVVMNNVKITDALLMNFDIDGLIQNVTVNGVDVTNYVVSELNRMYPERGLLHAADSAELRDAWELVDSGWKATIERARSLPESRLHESVDQEWTLVETLRHIVFATDKWFTAPVLGEPYDPMGLPNTGSDNLAFLGIDDRAQPSFDDAVAVREDRAARVANYLATVTDTELNQPCAVLGAGNPNVRTCLHVVLDEVWAHNRYANRDLDVLEKQR
ncbi:MAG TPA: DinB family protein [Acidimicrobiia bacterium]|nr:DinB family protein [Acidimicrobiia bacterium]